MIGERICFREGWGVEKRSRMVCVPFTLKSQSRVVLLLKRKSEGSAKAAPWKSWINIRLPLCAYIIHHRMTPPHGGRFYPPIHETAVKLSTKPCSCMVLKRTTEGGAGRYWKMTQCICIGVLLFNAEKNNIQCNKHLQWEFVTFCMFSQCLQ